MWNNKENLTDWKKISLESVDELIKKGMKVGKHIQIGINSVLVYKDSRNIEIEDFVTIGNNVKIVCEKLLLEENVEIGDNADIKSNKVVIGRNTSIGANMTVLSPNNFIIGENSNVKNDVTIQCREFKAGKFLQFYQGAIVGSGGKYGVNSKVTIGSGCAIGRFTLLNPSEEITIGDDVGIGYDVQIWTHGSYTSTLDGFPAAFAPVKIGNHVWVSARCIILPSVTIGSDVVIGVNSVVNKDIPPGCLVGGVPCKIIKENVYPKKLSKKDLTILINKIIKAYHPLMEDKNIKAVIEYDVQKNKILFIRGKKRTIYNLKNMKILGIIDEEVEDFRDFLRRNGIKFFTDKKFISIMPPAFKRLMEAD